MSRSFCCGAVRCFTGVARSVMCPARTASGNACRPPSPFSHLSRAGQDGHHVARHCHRQHSPGCNARGVTAPPAPQALEQVIGAKTCRVACPVPVVVLDLACCVDTQDPEQVCVQAVHGCRGSFLQCLDDPKRRHHSNTAPGEAGKHACPDEAPVSGDRTAQFLCGLSGSQQHGLPPRIWALPRLDAIGRPPTHASLIRYLSLVSMARLEGTASSADRRVVRSVAEHLEPPAHPCRWTAPGDRSFRDGTPPPPNAAASSPGTRFSLLRCGGQERAAPAHCGCEYAPAAFRQFAMAGPPVSPTIMCAGRGLLCDAAYWKACGVTAGAVGSREAGRPR
ncbi:hypothetical protein RKD45_006813 [Streptomyces griseus]